MSSMGRRLMTAMTIAVCTGLLVVGYFVLYGVPLSEWRLLGCSPHGLRLSARLTM